MKYAPLSPVYLQRCLSMVIDWIPTTGCFHSRFIQDLHTSYCVPLLERRHGEAQGAVEGLYNLA